VHVKLPYLIISRYQWRFWGVARGCWWHGPSPVRAPLLLPLPPYDIGCKVLRLHNTYIHSVASLSWCQITPRTQSCIMSSGILAPPNTDVATPLATPKLLQLETPLQCTSY